MLQVIVLSLLQGAFELFPVSSLGHTVLVPALLGWDADRSDPSFLALIVILHLGTATALLVFFWRDWIAIVLAVLRSIMRLRFSDDPAERTGWLIVAGSIVPGVLGLTFRHSVAGLLGQATFVAGVLILNGLLMLAGEHLRRWQIRNHDRGVPLTTLPLRTGLMIGAAQSLALLPGFSRSGTSMVAGIRSRLDHVGAARFSFLLATPLILGATLVSVKDLFAPTALADPGQVAFGYVLSGVTAYLALRFLMRYFQTERLDLFGYYCVGFGAFALLVLGIRGSL